MDLPSDRCIPHAPIDTGAVQARTIQIQENHVETKEWIVTLAVEKGLLQVGTTNDTCKIAVVERHTGSGSQSVAIVIGAGFKEPAAIAMTVAHDSHNLMVIGNSDALMAQAANLVASFQGGVSVVTGDRVTAMPLEIAGLSAPYEKVAEQSQAISLALKKAGCSLNYAFMNLSLLALVVIPELRLSDKGLVQISSEGFYLVDFYLSSPPHKNASSANTFAGWCYCL